VCIVMVGKRGIVRGWLWLCCTGKLLAFLVGWLAGGVGFGTWFRSRNSRWVGFVAR